MLPSRWGTRENRAAGRPVGLEGEACIREARLDSIPPGFVASWGRGIGPGEGIAHKRRKGVEGESGAVRGVYRRRGERGPRGGSF